MDTIENRLARMSAKGKGQKPTATLTSGAYFDGQHEITHKARKTDWKKSGNWNMQRMTASQNRRLPHAKNVRISIHADMMKISLDDSINGKVLRDGNNGGGGIRGNIAGFSRASRKRMLEFMASVRNPGSMLFLTMTYPDEFPPDDPEAWHADFEAFRHRFQRAYSTYSALWRMELVERKSGENIGCIAPHYHMIIFCEQKYDDKITEIICDDFWAWSSNAWHEIANYDDPEHLEHGVHCTPVRTRKHAYAYISKYIGKAQEDGIEAGRRWGRIGKFDTSASETLHISQDEYIALRRLIKRWLKNRQSKYAKRFAKGKSNQGCTIFGLGDSTENGLSGSIFYAYNQFIVEVRRQSGEIEAREIGYGQ